MVCLTKLYGEEAGKVNKEDWVRLWIHTPWGGLAAWIAFGCPIPYLIAIKPSVASLVVGGLVFLGEWVYEAFNDWRKEDKSYKDVLGIVWGFDIVGIGLLIGWRLLA